ncbi:hypothetical protein JCM10213_003758 [Rhodosporidiobolus nylandii]
MPPPAASTSSASAPVLPRDARLIALLLAAAGAEDCEEGVVRMLVEFAHRYTGDVLQDAIMYAEHAKAGSAQPGQTVTPGLEDVRLAVQARTEGAQVPKEFLLQLSTTVNSVPLPPVPEVYGIRLPPPAQRLTAPNFSVVPRGHPVPSIPPPGAEGAEGALGGGGAGAEDDEEGDGLFGSGDDDEDDEEMEDVTAGIGGSGSMGGANGGLKRKAEEDEEYD